MIVRQCRHVLLIYATTGIAHVIGLYLGLESAYNRDAIGLQPLFNRPVISRSSSGRPPASTIQVITVLTTARQMLAVPRGHVHHATAARMGHFEGHPSLFYRAIGGCQPSWLALRGSPTDA